MTHENGQVISMDPVTRDGTIEPEEKSSQGGLLEFFGIELIEPSGEIIREGMQVTYKLVKNEVTKIRTPRENGKILFINSITRAGKIKSNIDSDPLETLDFEEDQLIEPHGKPILEGMQVTFERSNEQAINVKAKYENGEVFFMDPKTRNGTIVFGSSSPPEISPEINQYELLNFIAAQLKEPSGTIIREGMQVTYERVINQANIEPDTKANDIAIEIKPEWI